MSNGYKQNKVSKQFWATKLCLKTIFRYNLYKYKVKKFEKSIKH